eukprot:Tbor_TRINITY_DN6671_c0_g1::TRINITY_DN6671_c0_g1_i1::g.3053::m.3053/K10739/RFA2, RPA2; replication factor A2
MDASRFAGGGRGTQNVQGGSPQGQRTGGGAKQTSMPLRPATIAQIKNAQHVGDGAIVIDGREAGQITVMGRIISGETQQDSGAARSLCFRVTDGTGIITVRHWLVGGESAPMTADGQDPFIPGTFVRATGTVGHWQGQQVLTGTIRPTSCTNEFTNHMLESVLTHLRITKGPPTARPAATPTYAAAHEAKHVPQFSHLTPRDAIHSYLKSTGMRGASQAELMSAMQATLSAAQVREVLRSMITEGTIFSDGNQYKC